MTRDPAARRFGWLPPALLLATHACLLLVGSRLQFPTRNEVAHVPAGVAIWLAGDFGLYNVNPPLAKALAALPVLLLDPAADGIEGLSYPGHRAEWATAARFADDNAADYLRILRTARLAGILWSVLGGVVVYRWGADLYGRRGGLLALGLWCFGPNVLAHAQLATPDVPAAVTGLVATYSFRAYLTAGGWHRAVATGLLLGVAQLTKFTMLVLYGVWPLLAAAYAFDRSRRSFRGIPFATRLAQGATIILISIGVINFGYGFDGVFTPFGDYEFVSKRFTGRVTIPDGEVPGWHAAPWEVGNRFRGTWLADVPVPLPREYVAGFDVQQRDLEGEAMQPSFLAGEWRRGGWWYYYLYGLAVKVPVGTLVLVLWGLYLALRRSRLSAGPADELTLWLPVVAVLAAVSSQTGFNHHVRYVLPAAPFACVATGKLAGYFDRRSPRSSVAVVVLFLWAAVSSLSAYPHSLSYFNELAGGPDRGYEHLQDSNIDWGQDLTFLKAWADAHPGARPLGLAYHNYVDPRVVGAEYSFVPADPAPGWYAIDVRNLMAPAGRCHAYQRFVPVAKAGYSIFIYQISPEDADRVRHATGP